MLEISFRFLFDFRFIFAILLDAMNYQEKLAQYQRQLRHAKSESDRLAFRQMIRSLREANGYPVCLEFPCLAEDLITLERQFFCPRHLPSTLTH